MSEPAHLPPNRPEILAAVAAELHQVVSGWRWIAQDVLAHASRIDLFGVDGEGSAVIVGVAERQREMELLGRVLAQRHWLAPRLVDWLKLAPSLGVHPGRTIQAVLVCHDAAAELRLAVESLELPWLQLVRRHDGQAEAGAVPGRPQATPGRALERLGGAADPAPPANGAAAGASLERSPPPFPPFRTGLTDADLGLTPGERWEFEPRE